MNDTRKHLLSLLQSHMSYPALPQRLAIDTSLTPKREEFQQALCILTLTHKTNPQRLIKIIKRLFALVENRYEDFLNLQEPMRRTLIELYKVPEKRVGNQALFRKAAAKIYCYSSNSFPRFKEYLQRYKLPFKANQFQFRAAVAAIITDAYRSIQKRVITNFQGLSVRSLDEKQLKDIEPFLMNLDVYFTQQFSQFFRREIKKNFCLQSVQENELTQSYTFYHSLREKMEQRQKQYPQVKLVIQMPLICLKDKERERQRERNERERQAFQPDYVTYQHFYYDLTGFKEIPKHHAVFEDDPEIWTSTVEQQITALFLQYGDLKKVSLCFESKYKNEPQLLDVARLKRKLIKIIRGSVRLLQKFYKLHKEDSAPPLPKLIDIDEDKVKLLIGSPYHIKACLLQFFRQTIMSYRSICTTISDINLFLREKSVQRFQKTTTSKAIIFSL